MSVIEILDPKQKNPPHKTSFDVEHVPLPLKILKGNIQVEFELYKDTVR